MHLQHTALVKTPSHQQSKQVTVHATCHFIKFMFGEVMEKMKLNAQPKDPKHLFPGNGRNMQSFALTYLFLAYKREPVTALEFHQKLGA